MGAAPNVRLNLPNRAENVLLVRQALSGLAESVGLDAVSLGDVSTAVTEAANNVVLHAYEGGEGPLEVEMTSRDGGLDVLVGDRGCGIPPSTRNGQTPSDGIGLPVIQALSDTVEFRDRPGGGTEVAMHFELEQSHPLHEQPRLEDADGEAATGQERPEEILLGVAPTEVARTVVPRVLSTLAARAYFTTDRISDALLLADTIVAGLDGAGDGRLLLAVSVEPRNLGLRIGPLLSGRAGELLAGASADGLGSVLDRLTDGHAVSESGSRELLDLRIAQRS
jgi:anti-sigma regulatory factor (Ser/Thr protein kinase)